MTKTNKQIIGNLGEDIVSIYLKNKKFKIIERNYWKPWGEIDIIAQKKDTLYFIEVKTVSRKNLINVTRGTNIYNPEDNIHYKKIKRLSRVFQSYLLSKKLSLETTKWQFDIAIVYLDTKNKEVKIDYTSDIII